MGGHILQAKNSAPSLPFAVLHSPSLSHEESTLMKSPVSVANKELTGSLTPLDATLMKNRGEGGHILQAKNSPPSLPLALLHFQCSNVPTFQRSDPSDVPTFRRSDVLTAVLCFHSLTKCPLPQPLSLHTLTNARGCGGLLVISRRSFRSLHQECFTTLSQSSASKLFLKTAGCHPTIPILVYPGCSCGELAASLPSTLGLFDSSTLGLFDSSALRLFNSSTLQLFNSWTLRPFDVPTFGRSDLPTFPDLFGRPSIALAPCVHFGTVFPRVAPENGMVMVAYQAQRTRHSRNQQSRSPESTWN